MKWFHSRANARRKKNTMLEVFDHEGNWVDDNDIMGDITTKYFMEMFKSSEPKNEAVEKVISGFSKRISEVQNQMLDMSFTKMEIEITLKSMNPTKAPCPDGAHALFFQKYWDIIGSEVSKLCLEVLNEGKDISPLNRTFISLIPKVQQPKKMEEYMPISLCSVAYKLIAKAIANRLKKVLGTIISQTQAAFVPGRLIIDKVVVGFEYIHAINSKRNGKCGITTLKFDMREAYDIVEWSFLRKAMEGMRFSSNWIDRIMMCVETVRYSILINGIPSKEFTPRRGIRQGDPL